ncbi:MAG: hypothetical protein B7Z66_07340 [Chromatiales bacterium 21-64-14]|nr:MAG: hypothetical protein B7Z66_07340 [Chromatiales bacterium 21-64-14]HQU15453.1 tetratricopeptide repeat protein [Gammaproteobacteria bacterium]
MQSRRIAALVGCFMLAIACSAAAGGLQDARALVKQGRYGKALTEYQALLRQKPTDADLLIEAARVYGWANRHREAIELYRRVLRVAPARGKDVVLPLAWQLVWAQRPLEAVPDFTAYLRLHPADRKARLGLGDALRASGRLQDAMAEYRQVLAADPGSVEARLGVARVLVRQHHYPAALAQYDQLLKRRPDDADLLIETARVYGWNNQNHESAELYQRVLRVAPARRKDVVLPLAWQLAWSGHPRTAVPYFREYLAGHPDDRRARLGLADLLAGNRDFKRAMAEYQRVLTADPENWDARLGVARLLTSEHQYPAALAGYQALLHQRPKDPDLLIEVARVYGWNNQNRQSAELYERVIQVAPERRKDVILPLAWQLTWSSQPAVAVPLFREYLAAHPGAHDVRVGLGDALADSGHLKSAVVQYQQVLAADSSNRSAAYGEGRALAWEGRYRQAEQVYRRLLQRDPQDVDARAGLAQVQNWSGLNRQAARELGALVRSHPQRHDLLHDLATAQYWSGFDDRALATLKGQTSPADVALRRHIQEGLAPTVSSYLDASTDSDKLHILALSLNATYHFGAARWLGAAYRIARLQQDNPAIPAHDRLYGREVLISGGQRLGGLETPWGVVWPSLSLGARNYARWETFAWRANAKWLPTDRWRVDVYAGNEVIENIRSIQNHATFTSLDTDVSYQPWRRINVGAGLGAGTFGDLQGDSNLRRRFRSHVLGVLFFHPRITAEWSFLYFNDTNPSVQVGYYNPQAYTEHRLTLGYQTNWRGWHLDIHGGGGHLTEDLGSSNWLYFWQVALNRNFGTPGEFQLAVGRTDSKQLASATSGGYQRTYVSLGYIYRF